MILETANLRVIPGLEGEFEAAFSRAREIIAGMEGYVSHCLHRCIEEENRYLLLVKWRSLAAHTIGFRGSPEYQKWHEQLHHFYDPPPEVSHYTPLLEGPG